MHVPQLGARPLPLDPDYVEARLHREAAHDIARDMAPDFIPRITPRERLLAKIAVTVIALICAIPFITAAFATLP